MPTGAMAAWRSHVWFKGVPLNKEEKVDIQDRIKTIEVAALSKPTTQDAVPTEPETQATIPPETLAELTQPAADATLCKPAAAP